MYPRWFHVAVVLLWLSTMSWLVTTKVVPSLVVGDPPSYPTILAAQRAEPPTGWAMYWNERRLGWAITITSPAPQDVTEVRSRVHFDDLPLEQMIPDWLRPMLPRAGRQHVPFPLDSRSLLVFDPLGRLSRFESSVALGLQEPFVKMRGTIDDAQLSLWIRVGELQPLEAQVPVPRDAMLGDMLSLQSRLPGLREGQRWTVETYSPLRPPNSPNELLHAAVESRVPLIWNGRAVPTLLVVYRTDPGEAVGDAGAPWGKLWVRDDGTVIKQQVTLFRCQLTFIRMPDQEAAALAARVGLDE